MDEEKKEFTEDSEEKQDDVREEETSDEIRDEDYANDDEIEMVDVGHHRRDLAALRAQEILADPPLEVLRLADVDDAVVGVFHLVDARAIGQ